MPQAWLGRPQALLAGPQAWLAGSKAWLDGPEGGTDGQTDEQMKNLPILQDLVSYLPCFPLCKPRQSHSNRKVEQEKRTDDHLMPLGNLLQLFRFNVRIQKKLCLILILFWESYAPDSLKRVDRLSIVHIYW